MRIAVDAVGGDHGPRNVVAGALIAARHLGFGLTLVGPQRVIDDALLDHPEAEAVDLRVAPAPDVIEMDEGPSALRRKPRASVRVAAETVASVE